LILGLSAGAAGASGPPKLKTDNTQLPRDSSANFTFAPIVKKASPSAGPQNLEEVVRLSERGRGDLYVVVNVQLPQQLSDEERALWEN